MNYDHFLQSGLRCVHFDISWSQSVYFNIDACFFLVLIIVLSLEV